MFDFYRQALICYVFLSDVRPAAEEKNHATPCTDSEIVTLDEDMMLALSRMGDTESTSYKVDLSTGQLADLRATRWLTRGWTLQELIAPSYVEFYDSSWIEVGWSGHREKLFDGHGNPRETGLWLTPLLSEWTGIPGKFLMGSPLENACISSRMRWAYRRATTRKEDLAYCLLGIFDVNMPLLYGEGESAFERLQHEIIRKYDDHSIFAFGDREVRGIYGWSEDPHECLLGTRPLAIDATQFAVVGDARIGRSHVGSAAHYTTTNRGIHITLPTIGLPSGETLAYLDCVTPYEPSRQLCLILNSANTGSQDFCRRHKSSLDYIHVSRWKEFNKEFAVRKQIYLTAPLDSAVGVEYGSEETLFLSDSCRRLFWIQKCYPTLWELGKGKFHADDVVKGSFQDNPTLTIYLDCRTFKHDREFVLRIEREKRGHEGLGDAEDEGWGGRLSVIYPKQDLSMPES